MNWAEFRGWAQDALGWKIEHRPYNPGPVWRAIWGVGTFGRGGTHTGRGVPAEYGPIQKRRLIMLSRVRLLIAKERLADWLDASETYDDGWLVNDGSGIRWLADPESEAHELVSRGFVAVKCGL